MHTSFLNFRPSVSHLYGLSLTCCPEIWARLMVYLHIFVSNCSGKQAYMSCELSNATSCSPSAGVGCVHSHHRPDVRVNNTPNFNFSDHWFPRIESGSRRRDLQMLQMLRSPQQLLHKMMLEVTSYLLPPKQYCIRPSTVVRFACKIGQATRIKHIHYRVVMFKV